MLQLGMEFEVAIELGCNGVIRYLEADISNSTGHLPPSETSYDIVISN